MRERGSMGAERIAGKREAVVTGPRWRRPVAELAMLTAVGVLMGALGPFGSEGLPILRKHIYWLVAILGGGLIGLAVDGVIGRRVSRTWRRVAMVSVLMTPLVTLHVATALTLILGQTVRLDGYVHLLWEVFVISLPLMCVRALVWPRHEPRSRARIEIRTVIEPPTPAAEAAFRRRLSARRRSARLIAIQADDHYLRVYTDAGQDLIALRFADALSELSQAHGYQVHRSWWISADAIQDVRWRRGSGEARLIHDLSAPVSRTYAPTLKAAGWL